MITQDAKKWSSLIHLSALASFVFPFGNIVAPVVIWFMKKDESDFIDKNGKSVLNFQISFTLYSLIIIGFFIGNFLSLFESQIFYVERETLFPLWITFVFSFYGIQLVLALIGAVRAYNGKIFSYPLSFRFL